MKKIQEYDLAYICYYSEKMRIAEIAKGYYPKFPTVFLNQLIQKLKDENKFDYYKNKYIEWMKD